MPHGGPAGENRRGYRTGAGHPLLPGQLAERLRQIPLSFFGKKDLSDLTSTIMADCTFLEQSFSHFIPELVGSICSTVLVAVGLLFVDWRMALAALWVLTVYFAIVGDRPKSRSG